MKVIRGMLLVALLGYTALLGFRASTMDYPEAPARPFQSVSTFGLACLCLADAATRRKRVPLSCQWYFLITGPFAPLAYVFWSRGWWALLFVPLFVGLYIAASYAGVLVALLMYG